MSDFKRYARRRHRVFGTAKFERVIPKKLLGREVEILSGTPGPPEGPTANTSSGISPTQEVEKGSFLNGERVMGSLIDLE